MNKEELAKQLDGHEYGDRFSSALVAQAKASGLLIICGASDDLMEFYGAFDEEIGAYDGTIAMIDAEGVIPANDCFEYADMTEAEIEKYILRKKTAKTVDALWCHEGGIAWTFKTDIAHATFNINEDDGVYCRGIVIDVKDLVAKPALPSASKDLLIEVFYLSGGEEVFICGVSGHATVGILQEIEGDLMEEHTFNDGEGTYLYRATHSASEEGCPAYWDWEQIGFTPLGTTLAGDQL